MLPSNPDPPSQEVLYDERFLARHAGAIITDPVVALIELVANAWDAYATRVDITWPDEKRGKVFSIVDNGHGMTAAEFDARWKTLNYNRTRGQGKLAVPPAELVGVHSRPAYGSNGVGRHAAFHFHPTSYLVRTWREGHETTIRVSRSLTVGPTPFSCEIDCRKVVSKESHGTEIRASTLHPIRLTAQAALDAIGTRFMADPSFEVYVNRRKVNFEEIAGSHISAHTIQIPGLGSPIKVHIIDPGESDRTTKQKGLAWWVERRLVGDCTWEGLDGRKLLDGRSHDAKRYTIVIMADGLRKAVQTDWQGFDHNSDLWKANVEVLTEHIGTILDKISYDRREERRKAIVERMSAQARQLTPISREKWKEFIRQILKNCPTFNDKDLTRVAGILANLELSQSNYGLLKTLHRMGSDELHEVNDIFVAWSVASAKLVLNAIRERLSTIIELRQKMYLTTTDEVHELQPIIGRGLWMFGPEFESIEFTSNRGMTTVLRELFGVDTAGSLKRPDFVLRTESTLGVYARPGYDEKGADIETERVVIVELKRPGIPIGRKEIKQVEDYYVELKNRGCLRKTKRVDAFVMGSRLDPDYGVNAGFGAGPSMEIIPMLYETLAESASKRMMKLDREVRSAPFLNSDDVHRFLDADADVANPELSFEPSLESRLQQIFTAAEEALVDAQ